MKILIMRFAALPLALALAGSLLFSCSGKKQQSAVTQTEAGTALPSDETGIVRVAEQIIYDVEIINPYPDDLWTTECLEDLDRETLVDFVFDGIYRDRFSAYDIFEGTPISAKKIVNMEKNGEFTRERIGKFQFREEWILDTLHMTFSKKVSEIRMGVQKFNQNGELTGYAPLLRVVL